MKTLFLDCGMGAAGDMLTAALIELTDHPQAVVEELNGLGIPGVEYRLEPSVKAGITGSHMHVYVNGEEESAYMHNHHHDHDHSHEDHDHDHVHEEHHHDHEHMHEEHDHHEDHDHEHSHEEHHHDHEHMHEEHDHHEDHDHEHSHEGHHHAHSGMHDIEHLVMGHLKVSDTVKKNVMDVYRLIAEAESEVHGEPVDQIHFHEVGSMDAIADVTAVCYLMEKLQIDEVIATPIHVGSGTVRCAHGILPVPAPATALILKDLPIYSRSEIKGELCTPTGAALLKKFATAFAEMPVMRIQKIGYGMGTKDFAIVNCVRAMLGEREGEQESVIELNCNVDDMTAEEISFAMEKLFEAGAFEVFTTPIGMKKSRPGTLITVITDRDRKADLVHILFNHTTTLGIRECAQSRYRLSRSVVEVETPYGTIRRKDSYGYGVEKSKYEYDDVAEISRRTGKTVREIRNEIEQK